MCKLYYVLVMLLLLLLMMMMIDDDAEWLLEAYRTQWLAMLQVDSGRDLGSVLHVFFYFTVYCSGGQIQVMI